MHSFLSLVGFLSQVYMAGVWQYLSLTGHCLSSSEQAALGTSLLLLSSESRCKNVELWGKVRGFKADYLIASCWNDDVLGGRVNFFSIDEGLNWAILDPVSDPSRAVLCARLTGVYMGDAAYEYRLQNDAGARVAIKESERLASFVEVHDLACKVVPRGAYILTEDGKVRINPVFEGLDEVAAGRLTSFMHLRKRSGSLSKLEKEGTNRNVDFLDPVSEDIPKGVWNLRWDAQHGVVYGSNLLFLGSVFFHQPNTTTFGTFYVGEGYVNDDMPFML
jgi:radial spoke head protein 9